MYQHGIRYVKNEKKASVITNVITWSNFYIESVHKFIKQSSLNNRPKRRN